MTRGDGILHPVPLAALSLLIVNDHALKALTPGVLTGKLSDVAGLAFFPTLLVGLLEAVALRRIASRAVIIGCVVATGVVFSLTKTWDVAADMYRAALGVLQWPFRALFAVLSGEGVPAVARVSFVKDPTDLVALPALLIPLWLGLKRIRAR